MSQLYIITVIKHRKKTPSSKTKPNSIDPADCTIPIYKEVSLFEEYQTSD